MRSCNISFFFFFRFPTYSNLSNKFHARSRTESECLVPIQTQPPKTLKTYSECTWRWWDSQNSQTMVQDSRSIKLLMAYIDMCLNPSWGTVCPTAHFDEEAQNPRIKFWVSNQRSSPIPMPCMLTSPKAFSFPPYMLYS